MAVSPRETAKRDRNGRRIKRWQVRWRYRGNGPSQSVTLDNRADAKALNDALCESGWAWLDSDRDLLTLIGMEPADDSADSARSAPQTVAQACRAWIERPGLRKGSREVYDGQVRRLGAFGDLMLDRVTEAEVNRLFRDLERFASTTQTNMFVMVKAVLTVAGRQAVIPADLAKRFRGLPEADIDPVYLNDGQIEALLAGVATPARSASAHDTAALTLLVEFLLETGLRIGEALAVQRRHLVLEVDDPSGPRVLVRQAVKAGTTRAQGFAPDKVKYKSSRREVPLRDLYAKALAEAIGDLPDDAVVFRPAYAPCWLHDTVETKFRRVCERTTGVPDRTRLHDLRHTRAKRWIEAGVPIRTVSRFLGHASVVVTDRTYGGFDPSSVAVARLLINR